MFKEICESLDKIEKEFIYNSLEIENSGEISKSAYRFWFNDFRENHLKRAGDIYEFGVSYFFRSKAQGKKITWVDGLKSFYYLIKVRFFDNSPSTNGAVGAVTNDGTPSPVNAVTLPFSLLDGIFHHAFNKPCRLTSVKDLFGYASPSFSVTNFLAPPPCTYNLFNI